MIRRTVVVVLSWSLAAIGAAAEAPRPNVLIAISDDQSWPHASCYGSKMVQTPAFDRIAEQGVLFNNAFCASPGCSPSRAALLTGLNTWQLEHAGTHDSYFHRKFVTFPERLRAAGYFVGFTGKGWGPGDFKKLGRPQNPAGPKFGVATKSGTSGHAAAFAKFLDERPKDQPFCFWFGSRDPHRRYETGSGVEQGKQLDDAEVPSFLPAANAVRSDLLDYAVEIERFDGDLGQIIEILTETGELDNTLVIVTSDNGMPFPRAKANCYEYGIHVPLAIRWGQNPGRQIDDLVGFTDLTATIYDVTGVDPPEAMTLVGESVAPLLKSHRSGAIDASRKAVYAARERHSSSRYNSLGYPQRAIRTATHLYIRNFKPERWPAGPGQRFDSVVYDENGAPVESALSGRHAGYHDVDPSPTLDYLVAKRKELHVANYFKLAVARRPAVELYDVQRDPGCTRNLAGRRAWKRIEQQLDKQLTAYLEQTGDPRATGDGDVWETYPRMSPLRWFPEPQWAEQSPESVLKQPWLEERRPRR